MRFVRSRRKQFPIIILITGFLSVAWGAAAAQEAPPDGHITVTTTKDGTSSDGFCSLREAVITANKDQDSTKDCVFTGDEAYTIELAPDTEYVLTKDDNGNEDASSSGDLDIYGDLTIIGNGATITAKNGYRNRFPPDMGLILI
ncbi:MAG: CSLREA domain-containing protein [Gammaproteobacteria bacterium]|nr:MAG: CSLREA domain-containing protein [Gammaproteobacteria bacterium]